MSDFDDLYGGRFLSSQDVKAPASVTSERIEQEVFTRPGEPSRTKAVIYFKGGKKGMVINKTNANVLAVAFGKNLSDWADKRMIIKSEPTNFGGKPTQGLRLYPVTAAAAPPKPPKDDLNDEIPW